MVGILFGNLPKVFVDFPLSSSHPSVIFGSLFQNSALILWSGVEWWSTWALRCLGCTSGRGNVLATWGSAARDLPFSWCWLRPSLGIKNYIHRYQETKEGEQGNYASKPCNSLTFLSVASFTEERKIATTSKKKKVVTIRLKKGDTGLLVCTLVKGGRGRTGASAK